MKLKTVAGILLASGSAGAQQSHIQIPELSRGQVLSIESFGAVPDDPEKKWSFVNLQDQEDIDSSQTDHDIEHILDWDTQVAINNTIAFNLALKAALPGDTVLVPDGKTFSFNGGVLAFEKSDIVIDFAGASHFLPVREIWPLGTTPNSTFDWSLRYDPAVAIFNCTGVKITSSSLVRARVTVNYRKNTVNLVRPYQYFGGIINGNGKMWWDDVLAGKHADRRPRLIHITESADMLVEKLTLLNSPYWTLTIESVDSEVREINVLVDRKFQLDPPADGYGTSLEASRRLDSLEIPFPIDDLPDWIGRKFRQPQDLNTDGIDPLGQNLWIHDCIIQNADDSVAVKPSHGGRKVSKIGDCTQNVTIENMILTGFGASVGSVPPHHFHRCLDNVTFRNITMPGTGRGIYIKSDWGQQACKNQTGQLTNIVYDNIKLHGPFWWALWVGPQQQHQPNTHLDFKCGLTWPIEPHCPVPGCVQIENITLRNVMIFNPVISPGVIMGNATSPIKNIIVENLTVTDSKQKAWLGKWPFHEEHFPWHGRIECKHAEGWYSNAHPEPACLEPRPRNVTRSTQKRIT